MRYQLINPINPKYSTLETVLTNRHIPINEIDHYLHTTDADVNTPESLGLDNLNNAATAIIQTIAAGLKTLVICDCDCDGFTSAALLINYLHDLFPAYTETNLK